MHLDFLFTVCMQLWRSHSATSAADGLEQETREDCRLTCDDATNTGNGDFERTKDKVEHNKVGANQILPIFTKLRQIQ